ncbi:hypothetical protein CIB48_g3524, partial [Xylaria polymorpha]
MAPLSNEPDVIRVVLNLARRKAFYILVTEIMAYMRSQLELRAPEGGPGAEITNLPPYSTTDARKADGITSPSGPHREGSWEDGTRPPDAPQAQDRGSQGRRREDRRGAPEARRELSAKAAAEPARGEDLLVFDSSATPSQPEEDSKGKQELEAFQRLYHPIPTRLTTIPLRDREEVLSATMLLLLSAGNYSAYARTLLCYLASALEIAPSRLDAEETAIATTLVQTAQKADARERRPVGLASVAGAAIVGVTGGLAAPVVAAAVGGLMGSVGLGGLAGFLGLFWMNGALVGALFGAFGAKMTGEMADRYAREVEDFKFLPLGASKFGNEAEGEARRLRVTIGVNGWLETADDVVKPWRALGDETEVFALRYEMRSLLDLGSQLRALVGSAAWGLVRSELLKRTVLATVQGALWPVLLLSSASGLDNPFSLARNRSDKAGRVLADALANRVQG